MTQKRTELATPYLSGLLDFWLTKCASGRPPAPSSIAPADLRPWKDNIVVFEVFDDDDGESGAFVYSYYGKALAAAFGHSRLGATLDALPPDQRAILQPEYESVRRERLPVARVHTADFDGRQRSWERLVLPMSSDGVTIDKLVVATYELTVRPSGGYAPALSPITVQEPGASA
ncbi:PAS domain-containing protein [Azospirillum doebereinerae]